MHFTWPHAGRSATAVAAATLLPAAAAAAAPGLTGIADFPARGQLALGGDTVAMTQITGNAATLLVGRTGTIPRATQEVLGLPDWAQPHLGTDAAGRPVVVHPRCARPTAVATCDLWVHDLRTGRDAAVPGVNAGGVGETEGVMDRGAVAFARWTAAERPRALALGGHGDVGTTLLVRPARGTARVLTTRGGEQLAFDRGRVLQVRDTAPGDGPCGRPAVELLRTDRRVPVRRLATYRCGLDERTLTAPTFVGDDVLWGIRTINGDVIARRTGPLRVRPGTVARVAYAAVPGGFAVAAPSARAGAGVLVGDLGDDPTIINPIVSLAHVTALSFTAQEP